MTSSKAEIPGQAEVYRGSRWGAGSRALTRLWPDRPLCPPHRLQLRDAGTPSPPCAARPVAANPPPSELWKHSAAVLDSLATLQLTAALSKARFNIFKESSVSQSQIQTGYFYGANVPSKADRRRLHRSESMYFCCQRQTQSKEPTSHQVKHDRAARREHRCLEIGLYP